MPSSSRPSRLQSVVLACLLATTACDTATSDAQSDAVVGESELTRPLQSGVARRTYGVVDQVRLYTLKVAEAGDTLAVDLTGDGTAKLKVSSADGSQTCLRTAATMDHHCSFLAPGAGTWTFEVTGVTAFSGSLMVTVGSTDTTSLDAGVSVHGPLTAGAQLSKHTTLGLPEAASIGDVNHWLLVKPQYVVSYNSTRKVPNWVSWQLNGAWLGDVTRASSFTPDPQMPNTVGQATNGDFDGSAYARGHMCPSADRTDTTGDNLATFVLTNVVPQAPTLNNGPWKGLENEERQMALAGKTVFITSGPIFGGTTIGSGVSVPVATWKVVVVFDSGTAAAASLTEATQVIAVIMPNDTTATKVWTEYRTTVRAIEEKTGLDLLSDVATSVQDIVETRVDTTPPL